MSNQETSSFLYQIIAIILALSGWGKVLYDYISSRPKIRARVFHIIRGQYTKTGRQEDITSTLFNTYLYLINTRRNSVHVLDYKLEVFVDYEWIPLKRVYGVHNMPGIKFITQDGSIINIPEYKKNLIYNKNLPVEYGKPLHGWIMFFGPTELYKKSIHLYRVTCTDAFGNKHIFETSESHFYDRELLIDIAGISIEKPGTQENGGGQDKQVCI